MKKVTVMVAAVAAVLIIVNVQRANAIDREGWERPILRADMAKLDARNGFESVEGIKLVMTKLDESERPTGLELSYTDVPSDVPAVVVLKITDVKDIFCGSVQYIANLPETDLPENPRFTIVLTDHTKRVCEDFHPHLWEASVRRGSGWCGTMDDTMKIAGNPKPVYTIMDR